MTYEEIVAYYHRRDKDPIKLGRMMEAKLNETGHSRQALARALNISGGSIQHFLGLLTLPADMQKMITAHKLPFKLARLLAQVNMRDRDLHALANPFLTGRLSTMYCEDYFKMAGRNPALTPSELILMVKAHVHPLSVAIAKPARAPEIPRAPRVRPADVREAATALLGALMVCDWDDSVDSLLAVTLLKRVNAQIPLTLDSMRQREMVTA